MESIALILGASSGMGLAAARKLADEGFDLILVYRCRKREAKMLEETWDEYRHKDHQIWTYNVDALKPENMDHILSEAQENGRKVNLFLHSLAKGNLKPMAPPTEPGEETSLLSQDDLAITAEAMAFSYYTWACAILQKGLFAKNACLLALTSEGARKAWKNYGAVAAAKGALEAINRNLALELAPHGLRANLLQPGVTDTRALQMIPGSDQLKKESLTRNPYHRLTTPEDVANAVYLLSRPEAAWINGAIIPVDGGENIT